MLVWVDGLVQAFNEEHHVASVLVWLYGVVERVVVCDDGSVGLTGSITEAMCHVCPRLGCYDFESDTVTLYPM